MVCPDSVALSILAHLEITRLKITRSKGICMLHFDEYCKIALQKGCFFKRFYLFIFRQRSGGEREGETAMCGCFLCTPYWGPGPQPRHVSWLGIEVVTLWFAGCCPVHWATPGKRTVFVYIHANSALFPTPWPTLGITSCNIIIYKKYIYVFGHSDDQNIFLRYIWSSPTQFLAHSLKFPEW